MTTKPKHKAVSNDSLRAWFHQLWYCGEPPNEGTWNYLTWMGRKVWKCPFDLWLYQEIIHETKPETIIETGTGYGGTAMYLASICDLVYNGKVITIDTDTYDKMPYHSRVEYVVGSSVSEHIVERVKASVSGRVMVLLDSDHNKGHVLQEMEIYGDLVTQGNYMVVEDSNINGNPVLEGWGEGPTEAIAEYLDTHDEFEVTDIEQKMQLSFNPGGYLRRK